MNRSLTHSLPAKVAGIFFIIILAFLLALSGLDMLAAYHYGIYDDGVSSYYETDACYSEMIDDLHSIYFMADTKDEKTSAWFHDPSNNNLRYAAYDTDTGIFLANDDNLLVGIKQIVAARLLAQDDVRLQYSDPQLRADLDDPTIIPDANPLIEFTADGTLLRRVIQWDIDDWIFIAGVIDPLTASDSYFRGDRLFGLVYNTRLLAPVLLIVCVFAAVADLIFLCCAAGHRYGKEEITLNLQDRIPLDLYLFGMFWVVFALLWMIIEVYWGDALLAMAICGLAGVGLILAALAVLLTLCTRFKVGKWWRNTVIYWWCLLCYRTCRGITRAIGRFFHLLPLVWRTTVLTCGLLFIQSMLTLLMFDSGDRAEWFLVTAAVDCLIVLTAMWTARHLQVLWAGGKALANGDFEQQVDTAHMHGSLREHGEHLNSLAQGLSIAVEQKMRSERMKTELITNVSHDIKTPLTSIINYVDLLQKDPAPEEQAEYLSVLDRQAKRLKKLTEDLVEASKASTGNLTVNLAATNLREILDQAVGEYEDRLQAAGMTTVLVMPEGELSVIADGRLLWRVLDNLLNNACKYAQSGTRIYLEAKPLNNRAMISMKNISRQQLNLSPDELMERFVRGDSSRNTEGSGLGLNIARSLIELQRGTFDLAIDGDLFKAMLTLPLASQGESWVIPHD